MDPKDAAMILLMFIVFGVPALALAARLVSKPILDAIERFREGVTVSAHPLTDPRIEALEADVARLTDQVHQLTQSETFHRELMAGKTDR
jgi:hypothetical protein